MTNKTLKPLTFAALQAGTSSFKQVYSFAGKTAIAYGSCRIVFIPDLSAPLQELPKPLNWKANGKLKTWKRSPERFRLPIKHGLYSYGYIDETNLKLFFIEEEEKEEEEKSLL